MQDRFDELKERLRELGERTSVRFRGIRRRIEKPFRNLREGDGWIAAAIERARPWHAVPAVLSVAALIVGGFWLGGAIGGGANAAVLTSTVKIKGKVITINGARYVSTPALTVKVKGKIVHIPARTVKLPASTVVSGTTVAVKVDVNHTIPVTISIPTTRTQTQTNTTTINNTVVTTVIRTTTQTDTQTQTVQGPTITETVTITLPVTTTVTVTATS
jgi:hypothetical protein